ncbi:MAG TPA: NAD(P)H-hydrate epimerase, partial [Chlamydiales bacterium]|nr:NAD(P)H-hydrate epimerase [Chlamydiales bacterium]
MKPVVTIHEMRAMEAFTIQNGTPEGSLMEKAGNQIASFIQEHFSPQQITLIAGKGNNAGDGFVALTALKKMGFETHAFELFCEGLSPLCQKNRKEFEASGGTFVKEFPKTGILLDGIFGIGFQGTLGEAEKKVIEAVNRLRLHSGLTVISIDIPSGLHGDTGKTDAELAVHATITLTIECPKIGFFLKDGWNFVGEVHCLPIGLDTTHIVPQFQWLEESDCLLPPLIRNRHKYQAGHVVGLAGSHGMCGAAIMASWAALKSGAGIVHLLHPESLTQELGGQPWEIVRTTFKDADSARNWMQTAKSCFIGPGLGRSKEIEVLLLSLWKDYKDKSILDADCLNWLSAMKKPFGPLPNSILTPHIGEMRRLLDAHIHEPISQEFLH